MKLLKVGLPSRFCWGGSNEKLELWGGNAGDRKPVPDLTKRSSGKLYGDKGYISQKLFEKLFKLGLPLITTMRKNMKPRTLPLWGKLMLRKRSIIETINDQLKNISPIEHTRYRSIIGFMVNRWRVSSPTRTSPGSPRSSGAKRNAMSCQEKLRAASIELS